MRLASHDNNHHQTSLYSGSQMFMEKHERNHLEQAFESLNEPLCFSRDSNFLDSEFCSTLEKEGHGDFLL